MTFGEMISDMRKIVERNEEVDDIVNRIFSDIGRKGKIDADKVTELVGKENEDVIDTVIARLEAKGIVIEKKDNK